MSKDKLEQQLAIAERLLAESTQQIERRKGLLQALESQAQSAREALQQYEQLHKLHLEDRNRLRIQLQRLISSSAHPLVPDDIGQPQVDAIANAEKALEDVLQGTRVDRGTVQVAPSIVSDV